MEEDDSVGLSVRAKLLPDCGEVSGYSYVVDPDLGVAVMQTPSESDPRRYDLKILRMAMVSELKVDKTAPDESSSAFVPNWMNPPPVNWAKLRQKEQAAVSRLEKEEARFNAAVSPEAQDLFNSLAKTLPCRWEDKNIVVMDVVKIKEPYGLGSVETDNQEFKERVRMILKKETDKLNASRSTDANKT